MPPLPQPSSARPQLISLLNSFMALRILFSKPIGGPQSSAALRFMPMPHSDCMPPPASFLPLPQARLLPQLSWPPQPPPPPPKPESLPPPRQLSSFVLALPFALAFALAFAFGFAVVFVLRSFMIFLRPPFFLPPSAATAPPALSDFSAALGFLFLTSNLSKSSRLMPSLSSVPFGAGKAGFEAASAALGAAFSLSIPLR
mmetsp:Transcript_61968/g.139638  ORF Transcript_61968/g.139638 Transcript_61968/m.139638 type:complete len:200 (-) Transcript_61968:57-656(-)